MTLSQSIIKVIFKCQQPSQLQLTTKGSDICLCKKQVTSSLNRYLKVLEDMHHGITIYPEVLKIKIMYLHLGLFQMLYA